MKIVNGVLHWGCVGMVVLGLMSGCREQQTAPPVQPPPVVAPPEPAAAIPPKPTPATPPAVETRTKTDRSSWRVYDDQRLWLMVDRRTTAQIKASLGEPAEFTPRKEGQVAMRYDAWVVRDAKKFAGFTVYVDHDKGVSITYNSAEVVTLTAPLPIAPVTPEERRSYWPAYEHASVWQYVPGKTPQEVAAYLGEMAPAMSRQHQVTRSYDVWIRDGGKRYGGLSVTYVDGKATTLACNMQVVEPLPATPAKQP
jgi:hypothetical protein